MISLLKASPSIRGNVSSEQWRRTAPSIRLAKSPDFYPRRGENRGAPGNEAYIVGADHDNSHQNDFRTPMKSIGLRIIK
jgi:hypothetical protein